MAMYIKLCINGCLCMNISPGEWLCLCITIQRKKQGFWVFSDLLYHKFIDVMPAKSFKLSFL